MTYYIYKTTNKLNGKIYVGKHRWKGTGIDRGYIGSGKILKKAIHKYGKRNFTTEVIEYTDCEKTNRIREAYWIEQLNSLLPNGYNMRDESKCVCVDVDGTYVNYWDQLSEDRKLEIIKARKEGLNKPEVRAKISESAKQFHASLTEEERKAFSKKCSEGWTEELKKKHGTRVSGSNNGMYKKAWYEVWAEKYGEEIAKEKLETYKQHQRQVDYDDPVHIQGRQKRLERIMDRKQCPSYKAWNRARALYQGLLMRYKHGKVEEEAFLKEAPHLKSEMDNLNDQIKEELKSAEINNVEIV